MPYKTHTQQPIDEQELAQLELNNFVEAQAQSVAPAKDPLNDRDRQIIATIVNLSDYPHYVKPEDVITIWINEDGIVWVEMLHGYARFHKESFKSAVAQVKANLSVPLSCDQLSNAGLKQACTQLDLSASEIDWLSFSANVYPDKLIGFAGCYIKGSQPQTWDFTPPKFASPPAAICPDCDGHGCANCSYRGTRAEDLCTPMSNYRFTYVGKTDTQTAYNIYLGSEFLGIIFRVRNQEEFWENSPQTYYWRCGDGIQYWSAKEAVEALSRTTAPVESQAPQLSRELVAA